MSLRAKASITALVLALGFGFVSCTQDEEGIDEVVSPESVDSPGAPESVGDVSDLSAETIFFAFDDYTLSMSSQETLNTLADRLKGNDSAMVQIEGHCDERGSIEYNLALGERRAQSVKNYLVSLGIEGSRLRIISYGEEKPATDGHDESAWSQNRRAEFVISAQ